MNLCKPVISLIKLEVIFYQFFDIFTFFLGFPSNSSKFKYLFLAINSFFLFSISNA